MLLLRVAMATLASAAMASNLSACGDDTGDARPLGPCEDDLRWDDDFLAEHPEDLAELAGYRYVSGNLTITGDVLSVEALGCLQQVDGQLYLSQGQLESLEGLANIEAIGALYVSEMRNLTSLEGLSAVQTLGSLTVQLSALRSFAGLSGLRSIAGRLHVHENAMTSFAGLEQLTSIGGDLVLNGAMTPLSMVGLENLESIGGSLDVQFNNGLQSMAALASLTYVGRDLHVINNGDLVDLGLEELSELGDVLAIRSNASLPDCQALALRDRLVAAGWTGDADIGANSPASCD